MAKQAVEVVYAANRNFAEHLCSSIASLLANAQSPVHVHLISSDLSLEVLKSIPHNGRQQFDFHLHQTDSGQFEQFVAGQEPVEVYFRYAIGDLVPARRVIFLDADTIITDDLHPLFNTNLGGHTIAAVQDAYIVNEQARANFISMNVKPCDRYFNAGVMLIDLEQWRREGVGERLQTFTLERSSRLRFHDQCALNAILMNQWLPLDERWNSQTHSRFQGRAGAPGIIHYCGAPKPWDTHCEDSAKLSYWKYRRSTQFRNLATEAWHRLAYLGLISRRALSQAEKFARRVARYARNKIVGA